MNKHIENIFFYSDEVIAEREAKKAKKQRQKQKERNQKGNKPNPFRIFLVRPRLILLILVNYLLFWFKAGFPLIENIILALIFVSVIGVSLTDIGECVTRYFEDIRRVATNNEKERLLPIFNIVKKRAMKACKNVDKKVKLYIIDTPSINACAIGKHTIAVTRGAMNQFDDEELEAVIAHEFGHIANGDAQVAMFVELASNIYLYMILTVIKVLSFVEALADKTFIGSIVGFVRNIIELAIKYLLQALVILVASNSRKMEYKADKFAYDLGYGDALLTALGKIYDFQMSRNRSVIERLEETHPKTAYRIEKLESFRNSQDFDEVA